MPSKQDKSADIGLPLHYAEVETIYTNCIQQARVVALAGPDGGEGVTSIGITLAARTALSGIKILLLELNLATPVIENLLNIPRTTWLPDQKTEQLPICKSQAYGFDVLTAPLLMDESWKFRDKQQLDALLKNLKQDYDRIIIDCSPINRRNQRNLPVPMISSLSDMTLMVLLAGRSLEHRVVDAKNLLERQNGQLHGCIINDRFNPGLASEISRMTYRVEKFLPKRLHFITRALRRWISQNQFLNIQV